ncbi:DUF2560 family protein [Providencia rettgeri]|uniref:DUF2560 family protein n=1 Tax=Providencia rettgeri TaxID=587 RepID=UPI000D6EEE56|nr:DUF2560 family protein [Providencia rettgeri]MDM9281805.1 DUF2560 family protein [Providencia rettgeri]
MKEITPKQQLALDIFRLVGKDSSATQAAMEFIGDSEIKAELFKDMYHACQTESQFLARAQKAVREVSQILDLFAE